MSLSFSRGAFPVVVAMISDMYVELISGSTLQLVQPLVARQWLFDTNRALMSGSFSRWHSQ